MIWRILGWTFAGISAFYVLRRVFSMSDGPVCSTEFKARRHGPTRDVSKIRLIVLHSTDPGATVKNPTARSTAQYFANTDVAASTQVVVGQDGCYRTLQDDVVPYGAASPANERGLHIEQAGQSFWTREQWILRQRTLELAAAQIGAWSRMYGIPLRELYADELLELERQGWPLELGGVTTHAEVTKAWHHTTHTDPGAGYPIDLVLEYAGE